MEKRSFPSSKQNSNDNSRTSSPNSKPSNPKIVEVYKENFIQEIKHLGEYLEEYNYVGMDTEFPGVIYQLTSFTPDFYYRSIERNVNGLKIIQLGISLYNNKGESPEECSTWQFNFHFDMAVDKYSPDSINLLVNSGIKFDKLKSHGIPQKLFAEYFITSGLVLFPNIHWICYHGSYDFAYLLKLILDDKFPKDEASFNEELKLYFPSHFDIKYLIHGKEQYKGGLNKLAASLDINRTGDVHQAGSDSMVTADVFFALIKNRIIDSDLLKSCENIIYGLGNGADNSETINYSVFCPGVLSNNNSNTNIRNNMSQGTALNVNTPMYIPTNMNYKNKQANINLGQNYGMMSNLLTNPLINNQMMLGFNSYQ